MNILEKDLQFSAASRSPNPLASELHSAVTRHFLDVEGEDVGHLDVTSVVRRLYSTVVFFTVETNRRSVRLVAKTTVHHPENRRVTERENQAVLEFNTLQRLYPQFRDINGCSVCKPLLVLPAQETVVIEFADGNLLADELGRARYLASRTGFAQLQSYFSLSGRWLRHFQNFIGRRATGPSNVDEILERCDFRLQLIEAAHDARCPDNLRRTVMRRLHEARKSLEGEQVIVSGRHGDFGPWNILCSPSGVTVLDFFGYREEPLPLDPLNMVMALERERECLTASRKRIEKLKQCFIEGYGSLAAIQPPLLLISETLQRICTVQGYLTNRTGLLHKRIERNRCIKSNVEWLSAEKPATCLWGPP